MLPTRSLFSNVGLLFLLVAGCSAAPQAPKLDGGAKICPPGTNQVCTCAGKAGTQTCRADGSGYDPCTACQQLADGGVKPTFDGGMASCSATCAGCCMGTTCVQPVRNDACGKNGKTCVSCAADSACDPSMGLCASKPSTCNSDSCPNGCCTDKGLCVDAANLDGAHCGSQGGPCTVCPYAEALCNMQCTTEIDKDAYNFLWVDSLSVNSSFCQNSDQCGGNTSPSPFVCFGFNDPSGDGTSQWVEGCTKACSKTASCTPKQLVQQCGPQGCVPPQFLGLALITMNALRVQVWQDNYPAANVLIGEEYMMPQSATMAPYKLGTFGSGNVVDVQFHMEYSAK